MKSTILTCCIFCIVSTYAHAFVGEAYMNTMMIAKYGYGDPQWQKDHDAWLEADDDKPMPEELNQIDGDAYRANLNAAQDVA